MADTHLEGGICHGHATFPWTMSSEFILWQLLAVFDIQNRLVNGKFLISAMCERIIIDSAVFVPAGTGHLLVCKNYYCATMLFLSMEAVSAILIAWAFRKSTSTTRKVNLTYSNGVWKLSNMHFVSTSGKMDPAPMPGDEAKPLFAVKPDGVIRQYIYSKESQRKFYKDGKYSYDPTTGVLTLDGLTDMPAELRIE